MKSVLISLVFSGIVLAQSGDLPDMILTPGVILPVGKESICMKGYSASVRNVPVSVKKQIFKLYNIPWSHHSDYEVDHLISLELGGSNDIKNLWPQSYKTQWNARVKDRLENRLRRLICTGHITLAEAQYVISHNWIDAYQKYIVEKSRK
jgi:hypothetical protein